MTGDFERDTDIDHPHATLAGGGRHHGAAGLAIYHQYSYLDTYDPAYGDDLYTNTATNTEIPDTVNHTDSDYFIQSSNQTSRQEQYKRHQNQHHAPQVNSYNDHVNMPKPQSISRTGMMLGGNGEQEEVFSFRRHGHNGNHHVMSHQQYKQQEAMGNGIDQRLDYIDSK